MAESTQVEYINDNGDTVRVDLPKYAMDSTMQDILRVFKDQLNANNNAIKNFSDQFNKEQKKQTKQDEKSDQTNKQNLEKILKQLEKNDKGLNTIAETARKNGLNAERVLSRSLGTAFGATQTLLGKTFQLAAGVLTTTAAKINQLGDGLNTLTQSGIGFANALEGGARQTIKQFNALGMTTGEVIDFLGSSAPAIKSLGDEAFGTLKGFQELSTGGSRLGMTVGKLNELFEEDVMLRQRFMDMRRVENIQQGLLAQNLYDVNYQQTQFSRALGVSTAAMDDFVTEILGDNGMFTSALLRVPMDAREELFKGTSVFLSGMRAMGGDAGGSLASAALDAATMGAIGFSDAAFEFITVLPGMSSTFQKAINQFSEGTLNGRDLMAEFTDQLGNLTKSERQRIFLLARAGDEAAKTLAMAVTQFEQSRDRFEEINKDLDFEDFQQARNDLMNFFTAVRGGISAAFNDFVFGFSKGVIGTVGDDMQEVSQMVRDTIANLFSSEGGITGFGEMMGEQFMPTFKNFVGALGRVINYIDYMLIGEGGMDPARYEALNKQFGGKREHGGPVMSDMQYLVGEKGPELFVPGTSGIVIPHDRLQEYMARDPGTISKAGFPKTVGEIGTQGLRGFWEMITGGTYRPLNLGGNNTNLLSANTINTTGQATSGLAFLSTAAAASIRTGGLTIDDYINASKGFDNGNFVIGKDGKVYTKSGDLLDDMKNKDQSFKNRMKQSVSKNAKGILNKIGGRLAILDAVIDIVMGSADAVDAQSKFEGGLITQNEYDHRMAKATRTAIAALSIKGGGAVTGGTIGAFFGGMGAFPGAILGASVTGGVDDIFGISQRLGRKYADSEFGKNAGALDMSKLASMGPDEMFRHLTSLEQNLLSKEFSQYASIGNMAATNMGGPGYASAMGAMADYFLQDISLQRGQTVSNKQLPQIQELINQAKVNQPHLRENQIEQLIETLIGKDLNGTFYNGNDIFNNQLSKVNTAKSGTLSGTPTSPGYITIDELAKILTQYNIEMRDVKRYLKIQTRQGENIQYNTQ